MPNGCLGEGGSCSSNSTSDNNALWSIVYSFCVVHEKGHPKNFSLESLGFPVCNLCTQIASSYTKD